MKSQSRIVLGVGVGIGYVLGRTKKMRLAMIVAAAGASGVVGSPRQLLQRGLTQLGTSADLGSLTKAARGQLLGAAKTAAMTAASSRIDALNERLQAKGSADDDEPDTGRDADDEPEAKDDDDVRDDTTEDTEKAERPRKRSTTARRRASSDSEDSEESDAKPKRTTTRSRSTRTPVRRARG
jgi:hypothetical protein